MLPRLFAEGGAGERNWLSQVNKPQCKNSNNDAPGIGDMDDNVFS